MNISNRILDILSILLSFACIIHCLFFPALLILLPSFLESTNNELIHITLLASIYPISIYAIYSGLKKHQNKKVLFQGLLGIFILTLALFVHGLNIFGFELETIFTIIGSLVLANAHFQNYVKSHMVKLKS